jgi:hypothetical protein
MRLSMLSGLEGSIAGIAWEDKSPMSILVHMLCTGWPRRKSESTQTGFADGPVVFSVHVTIAGSLRREQSFAGGAFEHVVRMCDLSC